LKTKAPRIKAGLNLRAQLLFTFIFCFIGSLITLAASSIVLSELTKQPYTSYWDSKMKLEDETYKMAEQLEALKSNDNHNLHIQTIINEGFSKNQLEGIIVDLDGKVLYKPAHATYDKVDVHDTIRQTMNNEYSDKLQFVTITPITLHNENVYFITKGTNQAEVSYMITAFKLEPIALLLALIVFAILFFLMTRKKVNYINELTDGLRIISKGNLAFRVKPRGKDELGIFACTINEMAEQLQTKIEQEKQIEQMKNELITNVSHDLRTPLTSILGYLKLIKDKAYKNNDQLENYIQIAYGRTTKLNLLIEDLFEYTTLSNDQMTIHKQPICMNELIDQLVEELVPVGEEKQVAFAKMISNIELYVMADPEKLVRAIENLLINAINYGDKPGTVKVTLVKQDSDVIVSVSNKGIDIPEHELSRLFERFYRVDKSRTGSVGGTGLGLAIAKSIVELHDGQIWAKSEQGEVTFSVGLPCIYM
jgi:signal transduction histidine kinase